MTDLSCIRLLSGPRVCIQGQEERSPVSGRLCEARHLARAMAARPPGTPPGVFLYFPKTVAQFEGTTFTMDPRYKLRCHVGHGAQGIICSAVDLQSPTGQEVAVKKLTNALDEVMASKRLLRELRLLRHLKHENLLSLTDIMLPPSTNVLLWKDVYIVSELMDTDLHYVIESGQAISDDHIQCFTAQLLEGVGYLHRCNVVHRDLKPGNILVDRNCRLKICDFGLARSCSKQTDRDSQQLLTMCVRD
jgi:serine/threonine protein kinase